MGQGQTILCMLVAPNPVGRDLKHSLDVQNEED
jgi:hypothetical protein